HGDVLMWLMKTLLTSGCTNQRGAGQKNYLSELCEFVAQTMMTSEDDDSLFNELLGVPSKSQQKYEPVITQEAHPQWGTW
ncbi:hypothetical protein, partial [Enterobacter hormaechei]